MILDNLLKVSAAQAFGAAAVSTNSIDTALVAPGAQSGTGEPIGFGIAISTSATVAAPIVEIISATDAALTAGILSHITITIPLLSAIAGALYWLPLPKGFATQRYLGVRITTAGGTVSANVWFGPNDMFSILATQFAKNYAV